MNPVALFGISTLASFISSAIAARFFVWPRLQKLESNGALSMLVAPHMFLRFLGLSFLVPGVVSPALPVGFANPAAYGDLIAGVLAIVATLALVKHSSWANASVWLFNLWGSADLLYAFYQGRQIGIHPGMLGATFFLVTALVPPLLVSHVLIFGLLARRQVALPSERRQEMERIELPSRIRR